MKVFSELIKFGCNFVLSMVPLPIEVFLRKGGLGEGGGKGNKGRLGAWRNPRRINPWWSRCIDRLRLVADGRRGN